VAQAADPDEVVVGQRVTLAHGGDLGGAAGGEGGVGGLGHHVDVRGVDLEHGDGVLGDRGRRHDHAARPLHRQVAHAEAQARAQVLAGALHRDQVVQRDHHGDARAQQRPVDPGGVVEVDAPGPVRVHDLAAAALGLRPERRPQRSRIAGDAAGPGRRAAVEGDLQGATALRAVLS